MWGLDLYSEGSEQKKGAVQGTDGRAMVEAGEPVRRRQSRRKTVVAEPGWREWGWEK